MIRITEDAIDYLRKNNYVVLLKLVNTNLCWGTTPVKTPWIEVKKHLEINEDYNLFQYEGINIYVHNGLHIGEDAIIKFNKKPSLLGNKLSFEGITLKS